MCISTVQASFGVYVNIFKRGGLLLNIIMHLPEVNNIAKFRATLIFERISSLNAANSEKKEVVKKVIAKLEQINETRINE